MRGAFGGIAHVPPAAGRAPFHRQILALLEAAGRRCPTNGEPASRRARHRRIREPARHAVRGCPRRALFLGRRLSPIAEWPA